MPKLSAPIDLWVWFARHDADNRDDGDISMRVAAQVEVHDQATPGIGVVSMERRGRNIRKGFLRGILPFIRWLPLTTASGLLSGFGQLEYRLHKHLRKAFQEAVSEAA